MTACMMNVISGVDREMVTFFDSGEKAISVLSNEETAIVGTGRVIDFYFGVGRATFGDRAKVNGNTRMSSTVAGDDAYPVYVHLHPLFAVARGYCDDHHVPHDVDVSDVCAPCL